MVEVYTHGKMVVNMKVNMIMIKSMDMANMCGMMEEVYYNPKNSV